MSEPSESGGSVFGRGLRSGLATTLRLLRIMLPLSIGFDLLARTPVLPAVARFASPLVSPFGLPGEAAVPMVTGLLVNLYGAVAAVHAMGLSGSQVTILGLMLGFAHTMPVEIAVLRAIGTRWIVLLCYRLSMMIVLGLAAAGGMRLIHRSPPPAAVASVSSSPEAAGTIGQSRAHDPSERRGVMQALFEAVVSALWLALKISLIVIPILTAYEILRAQPFLRRAGGAMAPALARFGISRGGAVALCAGLALGIVYGAGIILKARVSHDLESREVFRIALLLCTCHAIVEDTLLFVAVGANGWVIAGVRIFLAGCLLAALAPRSARSPRSAESEA